MKPIVGSHVWTELRITKLGRIDLQFSVCSMRQLASMHALAMHPASLSHKQWTFTTIWNRARIACGKCNFIDPNRMQRANAFYFMVTCLWLDVKWCKVIHSHRPRRPHRAQKTNFVSIYVPTHMSCMLCAQQTWNPYRLNCVWSTNATSYNFVRQPIWTEMGKRFADKTIRSMRYEKTCARLSHNSVLPFALSLSLGLFQYDSVGAGANENELKRDSVCCVRTISL